jgi:hypothetical protein
MMRAPDTRTPFTFEAIRASLSGDEILKDNDRRPNSKLNSTAQALVECLNFTQRQALT